MTQTVEIPFRELLVYGERQKKGELRMLGLTRLDGQYRVQYDDLKTEQPEFAGAADEAGNREHNVTDVSSNLTASADVAVVQEQKNINIQAGKSLVEDSWSTPDSNSICPVCQTVHDSKSACDQLALRKRFERLV